MADTSTARESKDVDQWPETFWGHHRNSLLFSSSLFILTLPGVAIPSVAGVTLGENGHAISLAALTVAATYAIIALWYEWRATPEKAFERVVANIRRVRADIAPTLAAINSAIAKVVKEQPELEAKLADISETPRLYLDSSPNDSRADFIEKNGLQGAFISAFDRGRQIGRWEEEDKSLRERQSPESPAQQRIGATAIASEQSMIATASSLQLANDIFSRGWTSRHDDLTTLTQNTARLAAAYRQLTLAVQGAEERLTAADSKLRSDEAYHRQRTYGIGLLVPLGTYLAAITALFIRVAFELDGWALWQCRADVVSMLPLGCN